MMPINDNAANNSKHATLPRVLLKIGNPNPNPNPNLNLNPNPNPNPHHILYCTI